MRSHSPTAYVPSATRLQDPPTPAPFRFPEPKRRMISSIKSVRAYTGLAAFTQTRNCCGFSLRVYAIPRCHAEEWMLKHLKIAYQRHQGSKTLVTLNPSEKPIAAKSKGAAVECFWSVDSRLSYYLPTTNAGTFSP